MNLKKINSLRLSLRLCASAVAFVFCASAAYATPTQEEVFQSITQHEYSTVDISKIFPYLIAGVAGIVFLVWFTHRRRFQTVPRALNHAGKLLKEVSKKIHIRPAETKALKMLAEEQQVSGPLLLLLCPSLLGKAIRNQDSRVDRTELADLVQRLRGNAPSPSQPADRKDIMAPHGGEDH
jgi:hypothetical protein